jgi:hypothetical protein
MVVLAMRMVVRKTVGIVLVVVRHKAKVGRLLTKAIIHLTAINIIHQFENELLKPKDVQPHEHPADNARLQKRNRRKFDGANG